jgi:ribosomal protein S18 acetylase RimI-like enzyme
MLDVIERYLDAVPLSAATPVAVGPFTLFQPTGPWRFYARPRLGLTDPITAAEVDALREQQRGQGLPENIEWVHETTPSLAAAAGNSGLLVVEYPLLAFDGEAGRETTLPDGVSIRLVGPDDPDFARAHAVAEVGFGAEGTQVGPEGAAQRDERAAAAKPNVMDFMRDRARRGVSITYAAFDDTGPIAVGTHQPVEAVTEIVGVATLPVARRRGIGAALTAALVLDALERGASTIFLSAGSDDVARVYERAGFRRIGTAGSAEAPSATA